MAWYSAKVEFVKDGRRTAHHFLIDAVSFLDVEVRMHKFIENSEFASCSSYHLKGITLSKYTDVLVAEGADFVFYRGKVGFTSERGKKITKHLIMQADNFRDAMEMLETHVANWATVDAKIEEVAVTDICEVIAYVSTDSMPGTSTEQIVEIRSQRPAPRRKPNNGETRGGRTGVITFILPGHESVSNEALIQEEQVSTGFT